MSQPEPPHERPLGLPPAIAGVLALVGVALGLLSMGTGWLPLGVAGLLGIGLAMGFSGSLRQRLWIALALWLTATGLSGVLPLYGRIAFEVAGPVIFFVLFIAIGQCIGLLAGLVIRRPRAHEGHRA